MKHNIIPTALTASLIALLGLPAVASAEHDGPASADASCSLPTDYPDVGVEPRRPPVQRRLDQRMKRTREQVRAALNAMEGLRHYRTDEQLKEARRRVTDARWHLENGAFLAAERTLERVDELVRQIRRKARELDGVRTAARSQMREYRRDLPAVSRRVDEANCTIAAGHLRKAEGAFARSVREADELDWQTARTYARKATAHQWDALNQAVATIANSRRLRRGYDRALSSLKSDLRKARRAGASRSGRPAHDLFDDAQRLKFQAEAAAQRRELTRATELARRGSDAAQASARLAVANARRGRRGHRHARAGRSYRTDMPLASASARWTSSQVW